MQSRSGRNEPCHCGSGKKYKKCCLPADEQQARSASAAAPRQAPVEDEIAAAFFKAAELIRARDPRPVQERLTRLGELFQRGAALGEVRFDSRQFAEVVQTEGDRVLAGAGASVEDPRHALFAAAIARLVPRGFVTRLERALEDLVRAPATAGPDRVTAATALLMLEVLGPLDERNAPVCPVLEVLFFTQLTEWSGARDELRDELNQMVDGLRSGRLTLADMHGLIEERKDRLAAAIEAVPGLTDEVGQAADRAIKGALKALKSRRPPALFTTDEYLVLMAALERATGPFLDLTAPDREQTIAIAQALIESAELVLDEPLRRGVIERLIRAANETPGDRRPPPHLADLTLAMMHAPGIIAVAAMMNRRFTPVVRSAAEEEVVVKLIHGNPEADVLEAYARLLDEMGEAAGAARVRRVRDELGPAAASDDQPGAA
ncbi:MAG TPA: SEC-C domain-containing protein [Polyangia bacterium]